jgi:glycosyltransferase involved in cell wall biosynthesis
MPSYNYERFIVDAVESVIRQETSVEFELVVQDGLSTDGTADTLQRVFRDPRLHVVTEEDAGQSDALNKALRRSEGDIIGWLNADEFYLPGSLEAIRKAAVENPDCDVFIGDCIFVDEAGRFIRLRPAHKFSFFTLRTYGCFVSSCATFIRRDALSSDPWDTTLRRSMDWDLWLTLGRRRKFHYLAQPLAAFRVHGDQVTNVPESVDHEEFARLAQKHGFVMNRSNKFFGRILHKFLKLIDGAYFRQLRSKSTLSGGSLRWWDEPMSIAAKRLHGMKKMHLKDIPE